MKRSRVCGFADVHPLQPRDTVQGAFEVINELAEWLISLTGMHGVAMSPKAGAHGELCGILSIRAALEAMGTPARLFLSQTVRMAPILPLLLSLVIALKVFPQRIKDAWI